MKAFASWSGGKDSCLACYNAISEGYEISHLLNMTDKEKSRSHGLDVKLISAQAEAMGIPILQRPTSWEAYEDNFKSAVSDLKPDIEAGVFGDIFLEEHREWVERVCGELDIEPILPLWGRDCEDLLQEFIDVGFEAVVVSTSKNLSDILGRRVDKGLIDYLKGGGEDLCGESGEYHTFVMDGPLFKKSVEIIDTRPVYGGDRWLLDVKRWVLRG